MNLSELVQFVTLKVSLGYLFDKATNIMQEYDSFEDIIYISHRINELWIDPKAEPAQRPRWENERKLHGALRRVTNHTLPMPGAFSNSSETQVPDPLEPRLNSMNLLLTAYETMWRVVLRCVLEVRYRVRNEPDVFDNSPWPPGSFSSTVNDDWIQVFKAYLNSVDLPSGVEYNAFWKPSERGVTAIDIVKEALRLYPPSRRIHRAFGDTVEKADIERCQRSALRDQDDPLVIRPER